MAKERLSKLQKWILVEASQAAYFCISKNEIYNKFWGQQTQINRVILSRSLKRLQETGYIEKLFPYAHNHNCHLTEKGRKKAESLNVNVPWNVNNKEF